MCLLHIHVVVSHPHTVSTPWDLMNVLITFSNVFNLIFFLWWRMHSMLWHCWLGVRKSIRPVKTAWWGAGMIISLARGANNLRNYGSANAIATPSSLASLKSRILSGFGLPMSAWRKRLLNGCCCCCFLCWRLKIPEREFRVSSWTKATSMMTMTMLCRWYGWWPSNPRWQLWSRHISTIVAVRPTSRAGSAAFRIRLLFPGLRRFVGEGCGPPICDSVVEIANGDEHTHSRTYTDRITFKCRDCCQQVIWKLNMLILLNTGLRHGSRAAGGR